MTINQRWMLAAIGLTIIVSVHFLGPVLTPFVISMVLAYLGDPLADRLEAWGLSRALSVSVVFLTLFSLLAIMSLVIIPMLIHQLKVLINLLPVWEEWLRSNVVPQLILYADVDPALFDLSELAKKMAGQWQQAGGFLASIGLSVSRSSMVLAGVVANLVLVPVVTFYLLRDWDKMMFHLRMMMPRNVEPLIMGLVRECDEVLGAFLKGQFMVMIALGIIYSVGLALTGLEFAILIGMIAGLASIVPYMGFVLGFSAAIVVAFFQFDSNFGLIMVVAVFMIGQALESWILTPWLVGDKIGLHPVAVIFALMAGGQLSGFIGMLMALPMAAIIMVLLRHLHRNYKASDLYHAGMTDE